MQVDDAGLFINGDLSTVIPRGKGDAITTGDIAGRRLRFN